MTRAKVLERYQQIMGVVLATIVALALVMTYGVFPAMIVYEAIQMIMYGAD